MGRKLVWAEAEHGWKSKTKPGHGGMGVVFIN